MSDKAFNDAGTAARRPGSIPVSSYGSGATATFSASSLGLCGEQRTWIVGVNWYLNDYVRLMFDYAEADLSGYPLTAVSAGTNTSPTHLLQ